MQFTEDWFAYDDAIAMRTWLQEAFRTELFGPTFENSGPWQLMKSSRDWIAPQVCRRVSEESEQSSALMYDNPPMVRGSPHSRQSNSATEHMDTRKGVQEGTITPNTDGSPARSKKGLQLEQYFRDAIQECAIEDEELKWSPVYVLLRDSPTLPELHFSENITDVDLNALSQRLEHVSQEKEFVSNLYRVQDLMRSQWDDRSMVRLTDLLWDGMSEPSIRDSPNWQVLANDIASFKAPSETPGHQDVMERVCSYLRLIALRATDLDLVEYPGHDTAGIREFTGVRIKAGSYVAEMRVSTKKRIWLGSYKTPEKAALVHDVANYLRAAYLGRWTPTYNFDKSPSCFAPLIAISDLETDEEKWKLIENIAKVFAENVGRH